MLKVNIDLWPFGNGTYKKTLYSFDIANDGTGTNAHGNYMVRYEGDKEWSTVVQDHSRDEPVLLLLYKVLQAKYGETSERV